MPYSFGLNQCYYLEWNAINPNVVIRIKLTWKSKPEKNIFNFFVDFQLNMSNFFWKLFLLLSARFFRHLFVFLIMTHVCSNCLSTYFSVDSYSAEVTIFHFVSSFFEQVKVKRNTQSWFYAFMCVSVSVCLSLDKKLFEAFIFLFILCII